MGDTIGGQIDDAGHVVVGKGNRQESHSQSGGSQSNVTVNPPADTGGIGHLLLDIVQQMQRSMNELSREVADVRREVADVRDIAVATQRRIQEFGDNLAAVVQLTPAHDRAFYAGFALLTLPVPLYFEGFLRLIDLNWPLALGLALACYALSAGLWRYMWFGGR